MASAHKSHYKSYYKLNHSVQDSASVLLTNINFASVDDPVKTITITSTIPTEGKSSISIFLAMAIADQKKKVLIIDADLRRPRIGRYLGKRFELGFVNYIMGEASLDDAINRLDNPDICFLDCGSKVPNPIEIFESEKFEEMLKLLRERFDYVIIDSPPVATFIDSTIISTKTDGTVLVCGYGLVNNKIVQEAVEQLQNGNVKILGCVLNKIPQKKNAFGAGSGRFRRYFRYYDNSYEYGAESNKKKRFK